MRSRVKIRRRPQQRRADVGERKRHADQREIADERVGYERIHYRPRRDRRDEAEQRGEDPRRRDHYEIGARQRKRDQRDVARPQRTVRQSRRDRVGAPLEPFGERGAEASRPSAALT